MAENKKAKAVLNRPLSKGKTEVKTTTIFKNILNMQKKKKKQNKTKQSK